MEVFLLKQKSVHLFGYSDGQFEGEEWMEGDAPPMLLSADENILLSVFAITEGSISPTVQGKTQCHRRPGHVLK
jgi:hypothetical protein